MYPQYKNNNTSFFFKESKGKFRVGRIENGGMEDGIRERERQKSKHSTVFSLA
jgi:hypothetical protein